MIHRPQVIGYLAAADLSDLELSQVTGALCDTIAGAVAQARRLGVLQPDGTDKPAPNGFFIGAVKLSRSTAPRGSLFLIDVEKVGHFQRAEVN